MKIFDHLSFNSKYKYLLVFKFDLERNLMQQKLQKKHEKKKSRNL